jgi:hypothetical protein
MPVWTKWSRDVSKPVAIDFADPTRVERLPRHGWAKNSQGMKLLWLPILRLVNAFDEIRKANGVLDVLSWGQQSEIKEFRQITNHFCLTLRELAKCIRLASDFSLENIEDAEKFHTSHEADLLIPLYVDLAFVYARRLADHFARAIRYVLFRHPGSAPRKYKELRKIFAKPAELQKLGPFYDTVVLQEAFEQYSGWFDKLRDSKDEKGEAQKGIRDIMEHHPIGVRVHHYKLGDGPWEVSANLGDPGIHASFRPDLISTLKEIVADMAALWTAVCDAVRLAPAKQLWVTPYGDRVLLTGRDDDSTAFWPESLA